MTGLFTLITICACAIALIISIDDFYNGNHK